MIIISYEGKWRPFWSDGTKSRRSVGDFSGDCWMTPWPTSLLGWHPLPSPKLGRVHCYKKTKQNKTKQKKKKKKKKTESSRHKIPYVSLLILYLGWPFLIILFWFLAAFFSCKKRHHSWVIHNWTHANAVFRRLSASKPERVHTLLWLAFSISM